MSGWAAVEALLLLGLLTGFVLDYGLFAGFLPETGVVGLDPTVRAELGWGGDDRDAYRLDDADATVAVVDEGVLSAADEARLRAR